MSTLTRARAVAVILGMAGVAGILAPAMANAAPRPVLSTVTDAAVMAEPVVRIEDYCGPTGYIKDPSRGHTLFNMIFEGATFHEGRWIRHYDARYLSGQHFKYTDNRC